MSGRSMMLAVLAVLVSVSIAQGQLLQDDFNPKSAPIDTSKWLDDALPNKGDYGDPNEAHLWWTYSDWRHLVSVDEFGGQPLVLEWFVEDMWSGASHANYNLAGFAADRSVWLNDKDAVQFMYTFHDGQYWVRAYYSGGTLWNENYGPEVLALEQVTMRLEWDPTTGSAAWYQDGVQIHSVVGDPFIDNVPMNVVFEMQAINYALDDILLTPEPATLGLLAIGAAALLRRRR